MHKTKPFRICPKELMKSGSMEEVLRNCRRSVKDVSRITLFFLNSKIQLRLNIFSVLKFGCKIKAKSSYFLNTS